MIDGVERFKGRLVLAVPGAGIEPARSFQISGF